jgi:hypothetical protein
MITRTSRKASPQLSASRCNHTASNGSRCRMLAIEESRFCRTHDKYSRQDAAALAAELSKVAGNLSSPDQVRELLAKILLSLIEGRLSSRKAGVAGYLSQMLLQSQREVGALKESELEQQKQITSDNYVDHEPSAIRSRALQHNVLLAEEALKTAKEALAEDQNYYQQQSVAQLTPPEPQPNTHRQLATPPVHFKESRVQASQPNGISQEALQSHDDVEQPFPLKPEPLPNAPPPDLNHFYPFDPCLKPGLQTAVNTIPPPDPEERRWRELHRRFTPRRR